MRTTRLERPLRPAAFSLSVAGPRTVQLVLAAFWAVDALLQFQPRNFTSELVFGTILGNAENQPQPIFGSLVSASQLLGAHPVELNVAIIVIQLALAGGLLWRRTVKLALVVSIPWVLGVWWLGEGFGGIFAGKATLLVGAPGPALLYALLVLVAWPRERPGTGSIAAAGLLGERATLGIWTLLWTGGATLRVAEVLVPAHLCAAGRLSAQSGRRTQVDLPHQRCLSHFAATAGLPLVTAGIVLSVIYRIIGQQFAGLLTGSSTDIASGPLYILLALTVWPTAARITRTGSDRPRSPRVGVRHRPSRARRARRALPL